MQLQGSLPESLDLHVGMGVKVIRIRVSQAACICTQKGMEEGIV